MRHEFSVIVDIDGTLADARGRDHFLEGDGPDWMDWEAHSLACLDDLPVEGNIELVVRLSQSYNIILCSGRQEIALALTWEWCSRWGVPWDLIKLRPKGDRSNNAKYKLGVVKELEARGVQFVLGIEDYHKAAKALTDHGIPTVLVASYTSHGNSEELLETRVGA